MGKRSRKNIKLVRPQVLKVIARLKRLLAENDISFNQVILFGSHAKGLADQDSDVDICLIVNNGERDISKTRRDANSIAGRNGINADIVVADKKDFQKNMVSPLLHEIRTHGLPV